MANQSTSGAGRLPPYGRAARVLRARKPAVVKALACATSNHPTNHSTPDRDWTAGAAAGPFVDPATPKALGPAPRWSVADGVSIARATDRRKNRRVYRPGESDAAVASLPVLQNDPPLDAGGMTDPGICDSVFLGGFASDVPRTDATLAAVPAPVVTPNAAPVRPQTVARKAARAAIIGDLPVVLPAPRTSTTKKKSRAVARRPIPTRAGVRRRFAISGSALVLTAFTLLSGGAAKPDTHWEKYAERFVQADGRVVEPSQNGRTTSEGQAYALFHAVVNDDPERFEQILKWTDINLASFKLGEKLPAWHWGQRADNTWGVLDDNSASDADLLLVYALLEGGEKWRKPQYKPLALKIAARVAGEQVTVLAGNGAVLLPGSNGFTQSDGSARLNPSYWMVPVFRRLNAEGFGGPWNQLAESGVAAIETMSPRGAVGDWIEWDPSVGYHSTADAKGAFGTYDAIRAYMWAGMIHDADPLKPRLLKTLRPAAEFVVKKGSVPERFDVATGKGLGAGPVGFQAAFLPLLESLAPQVEGAREAIAKLSVAIEAQKQDGLYGTPAFYYDQNLVLFGKSWTEGVFRFDPDGRLLVGAQAARLAQGNKGP